jgi:uncharacterized protein
MKGNAPTEAPSARTLSRSVPDPRSPVAEFIARHPVASFLLIALPLSLTLMTIPVLAQYETIPGRTLPGRIGLDMEEAASLLLLPSIFLTMLAVTAVEGGRTGVRVLYRRMTRWHVPLRWWLVATLTIPAGTVALALVLGDTATVPTLPTLGGEAAALLIALFVNLWEEAVWVGFMQTHLERTHAFVTAAALTAVPFGVVHMPLRLITGEARTASELLIAFIVFTAFAVFARSLFGIVLRGAANSILVAAATHTMFNRSNNVDGLVADIMDGPNRQLAALLTVVLLAIVLGVLSRGRLSRSYRRALDEREIRPAHDRRPGATTRG